MTALICGALILLQLYSIVNAGSLIQRKICHKHTLMKHIGINLLEKAKGFTQSAWLATFILIVFLYRVVKGAVIFILLKLYDWFIQQPIG
jgi:hypothetical protein